MKRFSLLAVLCLACLAVGQSVPYEKFTLSNGLTVIFHEDHSLPIVTVNTWFHVGSKDELPRRSGFAHLFEHLMFTGTKRLAGSDFDKVMELGGGWNNASTSNDYTNYYDVGPPAMLPMLLWMEADRLEALGENMDQSKLDVQRDVVRNERRESENAPYGDADIKLSELLFPESHPYHIDTIGKHEDLEAATVQNVKDFFTAYYVPSNASMVVAGDFDPKTVRPMIESLFGTLPRRDDAVHRDAPQPRLGRVVRHQMVDTVQFPRLTFAWHSPASHAPGDADMDLAAWILSRGISSRLYQRLIVKEPLATDVSAYQQSMVLGSIFVVNVTANEGASLAAIEKVVDEEIARLAKDGPTPEELQRQAAQVEFSTLSALQSVQNKANSLNAYQFYYGEPNSFERDLNRYRTVTPEAVRKVVASVLDPSSRVILTVVPQAETPAQNPRDARPSVAATGAWQPPMPTETTLSNGVRFVYFERPSLPLMALSVWLDGGSESDPDGAAGLTLLTADMLDEGAGTRNATEFQNALDLIGASVGASASQESTTVGLQSSATAFPKALDLLADALLRPQLDATEWGRVQRLHIEALQQGLDDPSTIARRLSMMSFFGPDHPYGIPVSGTIKSAGGLTLEQVKVQHAKLVDPSKAAIFAAGSLPAETVKEELERALVGWSVPATKLGSRPAVEAKHEAMQVLLVDKPGAVQTVIRFTMPAPNAMDPSRLKRQAISTVLGGLFTSRLNANLREAKGYTYFVGSAFVMQPMAGYLSASASVRTDVTGASLQEFLKEFASIRSANLTDDEAIKARNSMRTSVIESAESLEGLVQTAIAYHRMGLPFGQLGKDLQEIAGLTANELNALAKEAVPLERGLLVLVGDKAAILKQMEGLGLPEPKVVTAE